MELLSVSEALDVKLSQAENEKHALQTQLDIIKTSTDQLASDVSVIGSVNFGWEAKHFCQKISVLKINKMPEFYIMSARKIFFTKLLPFLPGY